MEIFRRNEDSGQALSVECSLSKKPVKATSKEKIKSTNQRGNEYGNKNHEHGIHRRLLLRWP